MKKNQPTDIQELDFDNIIIDGSVSQKQKNINKNNYGETSKKSKTNKNFIVSEHISINYLGKEQVINNFNDNNHRNENILIVKSDFNLLSKIVENVKFSYFGISNKSIINNIPKLQIKKNENENQLSDINYFNNEKDDTKNKASNNYCRNSNINNKENINQNILLNDNIKSSECTEFTTNRNINSNNEEIKEDENNIDSKFRRKSKNYKERIEKLIGDKNRPIVNAVISLNIPSEITHEFSQTQKHFDMLVCHFRQKQNKYKGKDNIYNKKYYEFYKGKDKNIYHGVLGPKINRIKYFQEAKKEDVKNHILINSNDKNIRSTLNSNNNILFNSISDNSFFGSINNNINKSKNNNMINTSNDYILSKTINSFNRVKSRSISERKILNYKHVGSSIGYSSALVYPSNKFRNKLSYLLFEK